MQSAIQEYIKEENLTPPELTEIMFVDIAFETITSDDMKVLAKYENLEFVNFAEVGLKSIEAPFPALAQCGAMLFSNNQLGNEVISTLVNLENLESLALDGNQITSLENFALLSGLKQLKEISLSDCPVAATEGYRAQLFAMLPQVEIIDDQDKEGNVIEVEEEDSELDSDDSEDEDSEEDEEEEDGEAHAGLGEFYANQLDSEDDSEEDDEDDEDDEEEEDDDEEDDDEEESSPASKKARN